MHSDVLTCHFKHAGLYDGAPRSAPCSVVKTYSTCALRSCGARCGNSLAGYVRSGNWSKSCFIGAGTERMLLDAGGCLLLGAATLLLPDRDMLAVRGDGGDDVAKSRPCSAGAEESSRRSLARVPYLRTRRYSTPGIRAIGNRMHSSQRPLHRHFQLHTQQHFVKRFKFYTWVISRSFIKRAAAY